MSFLKKTDPIMSSSGDGHIYYNILITNRNTVSTPPKMITYEQKRVSPFLYNPSDYLFSIIRFSLDSCSLPIFIPTMDLSEQGNITITPGVEQPTIYSVTLTYTDPTSGITISSGRSQVNWIPEIKSATLPNNSQYGLQDNSTGYYYCMSFNWWIMLCNNALYTAFNELKTSATSNTIFLPVDEPPFLTWNTDLQIVNISGLIGNETGGYLTLPPGQTGGNFSLSGSTTNPDYSSINIFFNSAMFELFNSFPNIIYGYGTDVNINGSMISGANVQVILPYIPQNVVNLSNNPFDLSTTSAYIQSSQEFSTVSLWNPVTSIVFQSLKIPVNPTQAGSPYIYDGSQVLQAGNNAAIISEITDFESSSGQYRSFINYTANVFRYIDLFGNAPLSDIDLAVYWRSKDGGLFPFTLVSGGSCSIKLFFKKRNTLF